MTHDQTTDDVAPSTDHHWRIHNGLVIGLLLAVFGMQTTYALREAHFGYRIDDGTLRICDYAGIMVMVKAIWAHGPNMSDQTVRPGYTLAGTLQVTRDWFQMPDAAFALPFPYSPTMLWLLGPFGVLPLAL